MTDIVALLHLNRTILVLLVALDHEMGPRMKPPWKSGQGA